MNFPTSVWWLSFNGIWMTASLFKFLGLFLIFWPISIMWFFSWSLLFLRFLSLSGLLTIIWTIPCTPIIIGINVTLLLDGVFEFSSKVQILVSFFVFCYFHWSAGTSVSLIRQVLFFCFCIITSFSHLSYMTVFHWNISVNKFPQVSRNLSLFQLTSTTCCSLDSLYSSSDF